MVANLSFLYGYATWLWTFHFYMGMLHGFEPSIFIWACYMVANLPFLYGNITTGSHGYVPLIVMSSDVNRCDPCTRYGQFSVPEIEYSLAGSSKTCSHASILLIVAMVLLLWHQVVLLWHQITMLGSIRTTFILNNSTIWQNNNITQKTCNRKYPWLHFLLWPPSGYSIWGTENKHAI